MCKEIFSDYGVVVFKRGEKLFVRYDVGELACKFKEHEISGSELLKLQKNEKAAYKVILAAQVRDSSK